MRLYKLTTRDHKTRPGQYNECVWGPGVTHSGTGEGELCGPGYIHAYEHPIIAVLMNPIHAAYQNPVLWEAEGEIALRDGSLKCGCVSLTTLRIIPTPEITIEQRVEFAIRCTLEVNADPIFVAWAVKWLSKEDRSAESVRSATVSAAWAAAEWTASAAWAAASAESAAWAPVRAAESVRAATEENSPILKIIAQMWP